MSSFPIWPHLVKSLLDAYLLPVRIDAKAESTLHSEIRLAVHRSKFEFRPVPPAEGSITRRISFSQLRPSLPGQLDRWRLPSYALPTPGEMSLHLQQELKRVSSVHDLCRGGNDLSQIFCQSLSLAGNNIKDPG